MSDKRDLTRIEDLSEYLHQVDPEVDKLLNDGPPKPPADLDELDNLPPTPMEEVSEFDYSSNEDDKDEEDIETVEASPFSREKTEEFGLPVDNGDEESEDFSSSFESSFSTSDEESESFESDFSSEDDSSSFETSFESEDDSEDSSVFSLTEESSFDSDDSIEQEELPTFESESFEETAESAIDDMADIEEEAETVSEYTPEPVVEEKTEYATPSADYRPETFSDVLNFAQSVSYGAMSQGGNPPFSVMLRNIKFKEDCEDIFLILKDHGLITPDTEGDIKTGLDHGSLLVSQISEYCAIFLAHKLRRFDLEIQIGLSDELHPSKSYARGEMGPINKTALMQNKEESFSKSETPVDLKSVLLATVPNLEGYKVLRYLGIISEHALIKESELDHFDDQKHTGVDVGETYNSLSEKLKLKALKKGGNAVLNVNYQFAPLPNLGETSGETVFKVTCTGNVVWVTDSGV